MTDPSKSFSLSRRRLLGVCSSAGLAHTLFPGALLALAIPAGAEGQQDGAADEKAAAALPKISPEMIDAAAAIAGLSISAEQKAMMLEGLTSQREDVVDDSRLED